MADLKAVFRKIVPPLLVDLFQGVRTAPIWEGVYPHFREVPASGPGYQGDAWRNSAVEDTRRTMNIVQRQAAIPTEVAEYAFLSLLASVLYRQNGGALRVLDFGGGVGISYVHLINSLPECSRIDYHVVELEWAIREGSRLFAQDRRVRFHRSLPDELADVDILHVKNALEYVEDYAGLLTRLCTYRARYFLFVELCAGEFSTYASAQRNIPGTVIPHWFLNANEIIGVMKRGGYSLIFRSAMELPVNQRNFPEEYRLPAGRPSVLLFARADAA